MSTGYDRKSGAFKPTSMEHVRVGGWAEVCVGEWDGDNERVVFGYVVRIFGQKIILHIADEVFSPAKTGLTDGQLIEVDLEDIFGSEYSPFHIEAEAWHIQHQIESQFIDQHWEEFNAFCPPEYRDGTQPVSVGSPEEWHAWITGHQRARRAFVEQLIRSRGVQ